MKKEDIKKVVLAYSGGLDTSIIIPWLKEHYNNCEVIAVSGNVGQADELEGLEEKAIKTGASKLYVLDLTDEYVDDYIIPTMQAGAMYEEYLLGTSHARPCIAKGLVEIAQNEGADAICHGCTGKGNDQVRFELAIQYFAPGMPVIAPWREWSIKSRDEEIDYAEAHNVPLKISRETNYSKDKNLWHLSHEGLDLEDPGNEPQYEKPGFLELGVSPIDAPDAPTYVTLNFEQGKPVALDGKQMSAKDIILKLNELGCAHVTGCDIDPKAPEVAAGNAALNGFYDDRFTVCAGDILADAGLRRHLGTGYDLVLANIVSDVIIPLAAHAPAFLAPGGTFICSGIIDGREDEVRAAIERAGFTVTAHDSLEEWHCFTATLA